MSTQEAFWDHFWLAKFFFQAAGILPIGGTSALWKTILSEILASSPLLYSFSIIIPELNYILFRAHDVNTLLEAMLIVVSTLSGQIRSIFIMIYRRKIRRLFTVCIELWKQTNATDYKMISIWANRARFISTIYFCAAQCPVTMFVLTSTVKQLSSAQNSTLRYYPFLPEGDSTPSPLYQVKYILLATCGYCGISFVAACDMTGTLLALNMCGQLALIRSWLQEISKDKVDLVSGKTDRNLEEQLRKCVHRHQVVMDFCAELEETVKYNYLIQIVTEMYGLAISGAGLQTSLGSYRFVGSLLLAICGLFFSCWPADNLSFASNEIAETVYQIPWHEWSPREKTAVAIMLMRSQRVVQLSAGNFILLSLETFSSLVSNGISFCLVLRSF